jgi:hypothetical protein
VLVLWSFGWVAATLPFWRLLFRHVHIAVVLHEPGGIKRKLAAKDGLLYSVVSATVSKIACFAADTIVVPRRANLALVDDQARATYLPLIYPKVMPRRIEEGGRLCTVLYLGRRDPRRSLDLFESSFFRSRMQELVPGCAFEFFPGSTTTLGTSADKQIALGRAAIVLNFYTIPTSQSGVTVDALMHGVPVLVSHHDLHAALLAAHGLALDAAATPEQICLALADAMHRIRELSEVAKDLGDQLGGTAAFMEQWLPWLQTVVDRSDSGRPRHG